MRRGLTRRPAPFLKNPRHTLFIAATPEMVAPGGPASPRARGLHQTEEEGFDIEILLACRG